MRGECAVLYRALRPLGFGPDSIDEWELWQIAVELGEDEMIEWTGATLVAPAPAAPDGAPAAAGPVLRSFD